MFRGSFMSLLVCAINEINKSHDSFIITFISSDYLCYIKYFM